MYLNSRSISNPIIPMENVPTNVISGCHISREYIKRNPIPDVEAITSAATTAPQAIPIPIRKPVNIDGNAEGNTTFTSV